MFRREALESRDGFLEVQLTGKVKGRIEQTAGRGNYTLGDRDAVERRTGVDAQANCEIHRVPSLQPPSSERQCFFYRLSCFSRSSHEKDPERFDSVLLDALSHLTHLRGSKPLLEFLQHRIAGALGRYSKRAKAGERHCSEQLGRRSRRREVGSVEVDFELSTRNRFADPERMTRRGIECRIDKIKVADVRLHF